MLIKPKIDQVKIGGVAFNAAYPNSFDTQTAFIKDATATGHYADLDKKEREAMLKSVYTLAKKFIKPEDKD